MNLFLWNSQLIFHMFWRSHFISSHENHWVAWSFMNWKYFQMKFKYFQIPFHLMKWKKSYHLRSRVLYLKRIWIYEDQKRKWKFGKVLLFPLILTFKKFQISLNQSHNNSNKQTNLSIYYNIPKFRILGCYSMRQTQFHIFVIFFYKLN